MHASKQRRNSFTASYWQVDVKPLSGKQGICMPNNYLCHSQECTPFVLLSLNCVVEHDAYGMQYALGQFESAVLAVSLPSL